MSARRDATGAAGGGEGADRGAYDDLQRVLRRLPGLGYRSAERLALHLLVEQPTRMAELRAALERAERAVGRCATCGNLAEGDTCAVCAQPGRDASAVCVVERVPDLAALERSGAWRGLYHVLHGRLSPIHGIGPEQLNLAALERRLRGGTIRELILALSNEVEAEATCHYLRTTFPLEGVRVTRIGFGLPSGGGVFFADAVTLRAALEGRRTFD